MADKNSFVLYNDYWDDFQKLSMESRGVLMSAVFCYVNGEKLPDLDFSLDLLFGNWKRTIDRDTQKWERTRKARSEAGKKGGIASGESRRAALQDEANEANASFVKQTKQNEANEAVTVTGTVTVTDTVPVTVSVTGTDTGTVAAAGSGSGLFPFASDLNLFVDELTGAGIPVDEAGKKLLAEWLQRYDFGFVEEVIGEAIQRKARKFGYLEGIVRNWVRAGITSGDKAVEYKIKTGALRGYDTD